MVGYREDVVVDCRRDGEAVTQHAAERRWRGGTRLHGPRYNLRWAPELPVPISARLLFSLAVADRVCFSYEIEKYFAFIEGIVMVAPRTVV